MADKIISRSNKNRGALPMLKLTLPIAMEQFFRILVSSVDTMMLSSYSNDAVAAVGLVSQYSFFLTILFSVIGTGCSIVLAQYLGAEKSEDDLNHIAQAGAIMVFFMSIFMTALVIFGTGWLLDRYTLEPIVRHYAWQYFVIYGGICCFFNAFSLLQGAILRSYGYTSEAMIVSIVANLTNVLGNALSLYGWFGLPVLGVPGVAGASGFAMLVSCILFNMFIRRRKDVVFHRHGITKVPREAFKLVLKVGVPTAGESLSYNVSQITVMAMISTLGTYAMSAQVYTMTVLRFVFVAAIAIGQATQIKTGYFVGAHQNEIVYKKVFKYQLVATACSMVMITIVNLIKSPVVHIFTDIPEVHGLVCTLLLYSAYIEFGRSLNLIYIGALKGSGDVRFPVLYGIASNWAVQVLLSYILGIKCGLGLIGFWLGIGTDETTRGLVMLWRWKSRRWEKHRLVE